MRINANLLAAASLAAVILCAAAPAQSAPAGDQTPPNSVAPGQNSKGNLSEKLEKRNGVIRPQGDVDTGIEKQTPRTDDKSVIKPPSGGDSNVQPK
jgi:hypothetical protein